MTNLLESYHAEMVAAKSAASPRKSAESSTKSLFLKNDINSVVLSYVYK